MKTTFDFAASPPHCLDVEAVLDELEVDAESGLAEAEVEARRRQVGWNDLAEVPPRGWLTILWDQLRGPLVLLLVVAAGVSFALGEVRDGSAILVIVLLNAALGLAQESRAEGAMAALRRMEVPSAKVRRDGGVQVVAARELVPGDLVLVEAGDFVPADGRLLEAAELQALESALTGESEPSTKQVEAVDSPEVPLGDRTSMLYVGTAVTHGHGVAVVTATGMATELGKIADLLQDVGRESTPLERRLGGLSRRLALAALVIVALVVGLGLLRGESLRELFMTALSLAVAAVPEGLPAVATVALALGARRMLARRALIRRLPAVETLGSVTVICSDKTGTLTRNRMTLVAVETIDESLELGNQGEVPSPSEAVERLLTIAALCHDVESSEGESGEERDLVGDPTEVALVEGALRFGLDPEHLEGRLPRVAEAPFDAERKRMTTVHQLEAEETWSRRGQASHVLAIKGGVDGLLERCDRVFRGDRAEALDEDIRAVLVEKHDRLAAAGRRVLGFAFRPLDGEPSGAVAELEEKLIFVGMAGLEDPPRRGVRQAVERCRSAGIRPVMITGDHPVTARAIADKLGIADGGDLLSGVELEKMDDAELERRVEKTGVFARVSPEHKVRIVRALQASGEVVAMTGDGVNDAPALRQAEIGLAMGITGTDVAKGAAAMVLLDDRFVTIVAAVEEGRTVYENIRKFVKYTLASNAGEIGVMLLGPLLGMPLPLLPLQILWINLVTDGLPGLALSLEASEPDAMKRAPYGPKESLFSRGVGRDVLVVGLLLSVVTIAAGAFYYFGGSLFGLSPEPQKWQTVIFTILTLSQMGNVLSMRANTQSLLDRGRPANRLLLGAVALTVALQLAALYVPFLQQTLGTVPLGAIDLLFCLAMSTVTLLALEGAKWLRRHQVRRPA